MDEELTTPLLSETDASLKASNDSSIAQDGQSLRNKKKTRKISSCCKGKKSKKVSSLIFSNNETEYTTSEGNSRSQSFIVTIDVGIVPIIMEMALRPILR